MDATGRAADDEDPVDHLRPNARLRAVPDAAAPFPGDEPHPSPDDRAPEIPVPAAEGPVRRAAQAFAAELFRLRTAAELSQPVLAEHLGYDRSYVTHLECCTLAPTGPVARRADEFFGSGEALTRLWRAYRTARAASRRQPQRNQAAVGTQEGPGPDIAAADEALHDADEHASALPAPEHDRDGLPGVPPGFDTRGATNVNLQVGNGNTQHVNFF
ncbi:multiprotein-bridging factor 1 family protein [Streptomyces sp. NPDC007875]|uniref:helix-turn-helix domain-containing protein n=1 Tax=Streptomyces sp. NPDC007875 TaxID=3364783 RepID=UPI0036AE801B